MIIEIPANTWVDVYAATGIPVGTSIILNALSGEIDVEVSATQPPIDSENVYPLSYPRTFSTVLSAGNPGCWAKSTNNSQLTTLIVQTSFITGGGDGGGGGVTSFLSLTDVFENSYSGFAGYVVKVNNTENGLIFAIDSASVLWGGIGGDINNQTDLFNTFLPLVGGELSGSITFQSGNTVISTNTITTDSVNGVNLTSSGLGDLFLADDGSYKSVSGGAPGGANGQAQYNDNNSFGGIPYITYDSVADKLVIGIEGTSSIIFENNTVTLENVEINNSNISSSTGQDITIDTLNATDATINNIEFSIVNNQEIYASLNDALPVLVMLEDTIDYIDLNTGASQPSNLIDNDGNFVLNNDGNQVTLP